MSKHFENDENSFDEEESDNHSKDLNNDANDDWYSKKRFFNEDLDDMFNDEIEF